MKKFILGALSVVALASFGAAIGCADTEALPAVVVNGGFESADLSGWTVEYGDAYDDDSVSSRKTFSYSADVDPHGYVIPVSQTGNWYLSGKGFDNNRPSTCTGAIRSQNFVLGGDGTISMKLAGGAQVKARSDSAERKPETEICFVGIYRAADDKMIARQTNEYFAEDASNIELIDYQNGTCFTDNFCGYSIDLSGYIGEELYIRIVDNDTSYYYGYLSVDDIRIGKSAEAQEEGAYFAKSAERKTATPATEYDIANGDFETGNIAGWEVLDGLAFSDDGVNCNPCWWAEQIPYEREGNFHYGYYNPKATGRMRSSVFTVGGTGYVTYKLGGCADNNAAYLSFKRASDGAEILRASNFAYKDMQFPNIQNGMRVINMNQYRVNLSKYLGEKLYIEVVDENASDNMAGCVILDSVKTYYQTVPQFTERFDVETDPAGNPEANEFQIVNGSFETGSLAGWDTEGYIGKVRSDTDFKKSGKWLFSGSANVGDTGTLTSAAFRVGGRCIMTFRLGGAKDPRFCYISLMDGVTEVARYSNPLYHGEEMVTYRADLSEWRDRNLRIRIVDRGTSNDCYITADDFVTYYTDNDVERFPSDSTEAVNLLNCKNPPMVYADADKTVNYQVPNGSFELGTDDLGGWELSGNIGHISYEYMWWNEWYTYNKDGLYFFSGFAGSEGDKGTLTSPAFTVGGSGMITYRLGGGMDSSLCYMEVFDAGEPEKVYCRFGNDAFSTKGGIFTGSPIVVGCEGFGAKMTLYKADLSKLMGKRVRLRLVDNATKDWGLLFADDFVTYYENVAQIPYGAVQATNILPKPEFADYDVILNFEYGQNSLTLRPKTELPYYVWEFNLADEYEGVTLDGNVLTVSEVGKTYEISVKATVTFTLLNEKTERSFKVKIHAFKDRFRILNGGFETGDLTGWTYKVAEGSVDFGRVESADYYWNNPENLFNKEGNYLFTGIETLGNNQEEGRGTLTSTVFTLYKNGWISFRMGGAHNAYCGLRVRSAEDDSILAEFNNLDKGVNGKMDLYKYQFTGMESAMQCYIEIFDNASGDWGLVVIDDIRTDYTDIVEPEGEIIKPVNKNI